MTSPRRKAGALRYAVRDRIRGSERLDIGRSDGGPRTTYRLALAARWLSQEIARDLDPTTQRRPDGYHELVAIPADPFAPWIVLATTEPLGARVPAGGIG